MIDKSSATRLNRLEQQLGLRFHDPNLLQEAMTHRSYINEHDDPDIRDSERLEYLGDAVLGFLTADLLFRRFPDAPEGVLTPLRSALVRERSLAALANLCNLGDALRLGRGEEANGGRTKASTLCDAFEALVGALYIDQGLDRARDFVMPLLERQLTTVLAEQLDKDARSLLQEWSQSTYNQTPQYRTISETGPDHEKTFTVEVYVGEQLLGTGQGRGKQAAAMAAARNALANVHPEEP